jgi:ABC-type transporter Mla subunit MlaD
MSSKKENVKETEFTYNTSTNKVSENQEQVKQSFNRALDQTKNNIQKTVDEAIKEIPRFTQVVNQYQEQSLQATKDIAENYLESQKEIINSLQSAWVPFVENIQNSSGGYFISPRRITESYARTVSNIADSTIAASRLVNNTVFANMEVFKTAVQHTRDNVKEFSRINANAAKTYENIARDTVRDFSTGSIIH